MGRKRSSKKMVKHSNETFSQILQKKSHSFKKANLHFSENNIFWKWNKFYPENKTK